MKTKLVYVVACASEAYYIEQALMSVFSARHWNPDAYIMLIVDDLTNQLLVGRRAEVLNYVSEKIVVPFEDESLSPMFRSRYIKTSIRQRIDGDFLFIDCDTIVCGDLSGVDEFDCEVGAVWESHLLVKEFCESLHEAAAGLNAKIGVDIDVESEYFSSGVMFVKDLPLAYLLYDYWHRFWLDGVENGLSIDQPSLAKANREVGHVVKRIPDTYNCILFTMNDFVERSFILHISSYRNPSFLFDNKVLDVVRTYGLSDWIKDFVCRPCDTMLPFDYAVRHSAFKRRLRWIRSISKTSSIIKRNYPMLLEDFPMQSSMRGAVVSLFRHGCNWSGAIIWMCWRRARVIVKRDLKDNVCRI